MTAIQQHRFHGPAPLTRQGVSPHLLPENVARALRYRTLDRWANNPIVSYQDIRLHDGIPPTWFRRLAVPRDRDAKHHRVGRRPVVIYYDRPGRDSGAIVMLRLADWNAIVGHAYAP